MKNIHIILRNILVDGSHEQIVISNVNNFSTNDMYLKIYYDEPITDSYPPLGRFDLSDIIGFWIEKAGE